MKILFLPKWYPNHLDPLDGIFVKEHAKAASRFDDIAVLYVHSNLNLDRRFISSWESKENPTELYVYFKPWRIGITEIDRLITACFYLYAQYKGWQTLLKKWGMPGLTHIHVMSRTSILAMYLKYRRRIPFVISEHWTGYLEENKKSLSWVKQHYIRFAFSQSQMVSAVTSHLVESLRANFNGAYIRFKILSNTADGKVFKPKTDGEPRSKSNSIVHISTLNDRQKNFSWILKSVKRFHQLGYDFTMNVIGESRELGKHEQEAKRLGLEDHVIFHGLQSKENVAYFLQRARFLVLFSNYETQSCVAIESIMCGTPVLSSNIDALNEVINSSNGILLEPIQPEILLKGLIAMWNATEQFNTKLVAESAEQYDYEHIGKAFHDTYKAVISQ